MNQCLSELRAVLRALFDQASTWRDGALTIGSCQTNRGLMILNLKDIDRAIRIYERASVMHLMLI